MDLQHEVQKAIRHRYDEARAKNRSYSLRAFARKLGLSAGAISAILNGKRKVSTKMAFKIAERLSMSPEVIASFAAATTAPQPLAHYREVQTDEYRVISEWYHFGILSLTKTKGFQPDSKWIAERLGITELQSQKAVERLFRLGLLTTKRGTFVRTHRKLKTSDGITSSTLRMAHATNLDLAQATLDTVDIDARDFVSITMPTNTAKLAIVKPLLREFLNTVSAHLEAGPKNEVYKLCIQLFPITKLSDNKTEEA